MIGLMHEVLAAAFLDTSNSTKRVLETFTVLFIDLYTLFKHIPNFSHILGRFSGFLQYIELFTPQLNGRIRQ